MEREAAPGGNESAKGRRGDWRSGGEKIEYLEGEEGTGGGEDEHVHGWGVDGMKGYLGWRKRADLTWGEGGKPDLEGEIRMD